MKDDVIVVEKGKEKWEIARDKDTKVTGGDLKVGSKVTVFYTMKASSIEVKGEAKKAEPTKAEPKKTEPKKQ
jgi:deoxycytidine triphosphate deaminase